MTSGSGGKGASVCLLHPCVLTLILPPGDTGLLKLARGKGVLWKEQDVRNILFGKNKTKGNINVKVRGEIESQNNAEKNFFRVEER